MAYIYRERPPEAWQARLDQRGDEDDAGEPEGAVIDFPRERIVHQRPTAAVASAPAEPGRPPSGTPDHEAVTDAPPSAPSRGDWTSPRQDAEAVEFLAMLQPAVAWQLTAIDPDSGAIETREFTIAGFAQAWIAAWQGRRNLYFTVNPSTSGNKKPTKADITAVAAFHADLDPPKRGDLDLAMVRNNILDRLKCYRLPPTAIVMSGAGLQALWRLVEPVPVQDKADIAKFEAVNKALESDLIEPGSSGGCFNIDRIMRVPSTVNLPNAAKRKLGRVAAVATLYSFDTKGTYRLDDFASLADTSEGARDSKSDTGKSRDDQRRDGDADDDLPSLDDPKLQQVIALGYDPDDPQRWPSRSEAVFFVACALIRKYWSDAQIRRVLLDPNNHINAHVFAQKDPERAVDNAINNAHRNVREAVAEARSQGQQQRRGNGYDHADQQPRGRTHAPSSTTQAASLHDKVVPVRRWVIEDWIPARRVTALYGHGGEGKTTILQQLQTDAAINAPWLGLPVAAVRSLGVYCEDDEEEMHIRQDIINRRYGCDYPELADVYWKARLGEDNLLMTFDSRGKAEPTRFWYELRDEACDLKVDFIIIDTVTDCFGGKENDRSQVRQFGQWALGGLARAIDGAVILTAHPSLQGMTTGTGTSGTTEWEAVFRSRIYMRRPKTETGEEDDTDRRLLERKKANYARRDETIDLVWNNGVFSRDPASVNRSKRPSTMVFLDLLDEFDRQGRTVTDSLQGNYAPRLFAQQSRMLRDSHRMEDFAVAMEELFHRQTIRKEAYQTAQRKWRERIVRNRR